MVLAALAVEALPGRVQLLHVNHHLRSEAALDEALVRRWAAQHELPLRVIHLRPCDLKAPEGLEAAARRARYEALRRHTPDGWAAVTGHHANDRVETLLMRLQQGAGLGGLGGPRRSHRDGAFRLLRPLLYLWRSELEVEAHRRALPFAHDATNDDQRLDRNRLRHAVVAPWLEQAPRAPLARSLALLDEERQLLGTLLDERLEGRFRETETGWELSRSLLTEGSARLAAALLRTCLRRSGAGRPSAAFVQSVVRRARLPGPFSQHGEGIRLEASRTTVTWRR